MEYATVNVAVRTHSDNKLDHQSSPEFAVGHLKYGIFSFVYEHRLCISSGLLFCVQLWAVFDASEDG